jgi:hypothetical protein
MSAITHHPHRVAQAVAEVRSQLTDVAGASVWSLDAVLTTETLAEVGAAKAQLAELEARLLAHADAIDVRALTGASSTATWHARATRTIQVAAHRTMRLASALEQRDLTRAALAEGRLHLDQAEAILKAVYQLPEGLDQALVAQAEAHLIEEAGHFDAKALKNLGRHLLAVIDPDAADAHIAKLLEREERAAQAATRLQIWDDGHGRVHGKFTVDAVTGAALKKAMFAFAAPKHRASQEPLGERKPTPERLGQAFVEMIQRYPTKRLPKAGGLNATVVVLMPLETMMGGLKAAKLDTGEEISPGAARRLACEARIIPAVLGSKSQVLDQGRATRFHTEVQRVAKIAEASGCEVDGCDWPPGLCHLHHPIRWADGGGTDRDGIMICPPHHARAHDPRCQMKKLPTGKYTFHRRT